MLGLGEAIAVVVGWMIVVRGMYSVTRWEDRTLVLLLLLVLCWQKWMLRVLGVLVLIEMGAT